VVTCSCAAAEALDSAADGTLDEKTLRPAEEAELEQEFSQGMSALIVGALALLKRKA